MKNYSSSEWKKYLAETKERINLDEASVALKYESDLKDDLIDFIKNNLKILESCYDNYAETETDEFVLLNYKNQKNKKFLELISKCQILILTANPIEKAILHYYAVNNNKNDKITRILHNDLFYYFFRWNGYNVVHIPQFETGSHKDQGTYATLSNALKYFKPNVIFSVGVAFGVDYKTQQIGDVLVSKEILPYDSNKRDRNIIIPDRTQDKKIFRSLKNRLENSSVFMSNVHYGSIVTGGSVISSLEEKDRVCMAYENVDCVVGGEMEGNALFQICESENISCAVIKGICDWGVAKNNLFEDISKISDMPDSMNEKKAKDSLQAYAMTQTLEKLDILFKDDILFADDSDNESRFKINPNYITSIISIGVLLYFVLNNIEFAINSINITVFICILVALVLMVVVLLCFLIKEHRTRSKTTKYLNKLLGMNDKK